MARALSLDHDGLEWDVMIPLLRDGRLPNMAKLMQLLEQEGIADNTILVFMTDNGTAGGLKNGRGYDGGMRGMKNSEYDGGHRVPFILRWPDGKIKAGKDAQRDMCLRNVKQYLVMDDEPRYLKCLAMALLIV